MPKCRIKVNNMGENPKKWVVARLDGRDLSLWYWDSFDDKAEANKSAAEINGIVVELEEVKG